VDELVELVVDELLVSAGFGAADEICIVIL
jgi:hypothetical protein